MHNVTKQFQNEELRFRQKKSLDLRGQRPLGLDHVVLVGDTAVHAAALGALVPVIVKPQSLVDRSRHLNLDLLVLSGGLVEPLTLDGHRLLLGRVLGRLARHLRRPGVTRQTEQARAAPLLGRLEAAQLAGAGRAGAEADGRALVAAVEVFLVEGHVGDGSARFGG